MRFIDLTGKKFGRLTVINRTANSNTGKARWLCICECDGKEKIVFGDSLKSGNTQSCGCLKKENFNNNIHGLTNNKIYSTWCNMKSRCYNSNNTMFEYYGGNNIPIKISDEFINDFKTFYDYVSVLPDVDKENYTLDRINSKGIYARGNLRWASYSIQSFNRRKQKSNISGIVGVYYNKNRLTKPWTAYITKDKKRIHLGYSKTKEEAIKLRKEAELKYYGFTLL